MKSTNPQSPDRSTDRSHSADGRMSRPSSRRSSQPKFVLQPVVLDDAAAPDPNDQRNEPEESMHTTMDAMGSQDNATWLADEVTATPGAASSRRTGSRDQTRTTPVDQYPSPPGRPVIIGALFVCGVIAVVLFVTLLLAGRAPVA